MNDLEKAIETKQIIDRLFERISKITQEEKEWLPIKNVILSAHNVLEGLLNLLLSRYYLGKDMEETDKNKVNNFWINVLVETNFAKKIRIIEEAEIFSKENKVLSAFSKINNIRNDLAHYPHRKYKRKSNHLMYSGKHIFKDIEAIRMFSGDFDMILDSVRKVIKEQENK